MSTTGGNKGANYAKLISIASSRRIPGSAYSTSNFLFNAGQNLQNIQRVSIPSVAFFNNIYNITNDPTGNNTTYSYSYNGNPPHTFSLTPGYYNISLLLNLLNQDIVNTYGTVASWSIDPITNLVSLTVGAGELITLNTGTSPNLQLMTTLGGGSFVVTPKAIAGPGLATGITFPLLSSPIQVYIRSTALAPANAIEDSGRFCNTLLALNVTAPYLGLNQFECKVDSLCELIYTRPRDIGTIDIQLTDRDGNIIDLHGGSLDVEIKVWFNRY